MSKLDEIINCVRPNMASKLNWLKKNLVLDNKTCLFSTKRENFGSYDDSTCN